ncbi:MAG: hypothetical protein ACP5SI_09695, partial [Chloroflexia bacterium]
AELQAVWEIFLGLCRAGRWDVWPVEEAYAFEEYLEQEGFPPVHHSRAYAAAERPAYRLVASSFLPRLLRQ